MIDLHTHSFLSDGVLIPSELIQRARKKGYKAIGLTDHADSSNMIDIIKSLRRVCADMNKAYGDILCLPGVEITHVPPSMAAVLVKKARAAGAAIVVFHGETVTEPVEPGTNLAAIKAGVDILAHPGMITQEEAVIASRNGVLLEITARGGHNKTNKHVAEMAVKAGASMCFDTDAHTPGDLADAESREKVLKEAGLTKEQIQAVIENSKELVKKVKRFVPGAGAIVL